MSQALRLRHVTRYAFARPVEGAAVRARLIDRPGPGLRAASAQVTVLPLAAEVRAAEDDDGNRCLDFRLVGPVRRLEIVQEATVVAVAGTAIAPAPPASFAAAGRASAAAGWAALHIRTAPSPLEAAAWLCAAIAAEIKAPPSLRSREFAAALARRRGDCADLARLAAAALRGHGIAVRCVVGYLHEGWRAGAASPELEFPEATHAWIELDDPARGVHAFDPARGLPAGAGYVRLAAGRDIPPPVAIRVAGRIRHRLDVAIRLEPVVGRADRPIAA